MTNLIKKIYICAVVIMLTFAVLPFVTETVVYAANYYVYPAGSDSNSGTLTDPFGSITKAQSAASSGDTVYLRGGTYKNFKIAKSDNNYNYIHDLTKSGITYNEVPIHTVKNCLAADNKAHGFYSNHQPGQSATWTNNTAYNAQGNFNMLERVSVNDATDIPGTREVLHYNLAYKGISIDKANLPTRNVTNNSWNKSGVSVSPEDFQSLDSSQMIKPREKDGALPNITNSTFMKPVSGSDVVGLGCFK